jgi:hypothetical protein
MSVQMRSEDGSILNIPVSASKESSINFSVPDLDVDRACRLLSDYTEQLNAQIKANYNESNINTLQVYSFISILILLMIYGSLGTGTNRIIFTVIIASFSIIFMGMISLKYYLLNIKKNVPYIMTVFDELQSIANKAHHINEHSELSFWSQKELSIKLQRAESALINARKVLKIKKS